ncbi:PqqD family protein [Niallia circulans]|jgi:acetylornithine/succinyldiaminopimelate/putrescine aminotransferase|uniref:Metallophosphoesterase n=1 Tax=Niallia circulans TaxID=1397 RepID=A0A0J1IJ47_NIACI|nr:lasso peptide biosynthesis PqqD family chaperone [Niallia circulans]KLV25971.1 metallophosphoesterase [Niallia circulans]MCM2983540.1 lasso peptide biosynthesis PqqD family chaperone [Niallia circulans]MDR4317688.1 lasso peptide biosynthesis PqqD family chaperone [Niallia circulans]MED3841178.1 lasso peptide biosynthesis PqqD family chaperone [Niallia circulans]MED4245755.1 lasso peptide biosynthesis PqqD family chaperone [Niallia circulans]
MRKTQAQINKQTIVVQTPGHIVSDMNGEKVMLSIANSKYYNLGHIGGDIWELIKEPISIDRVVAILMEKYEVTQRKCEQHVCSFLETLKEEGLITIKST